MLEQLTTILPFGVLALHGGLAVLLIYVALSSPRDRQKLIKQISAYAYHIVFGASAAATLGSLYYSSIVGFTPCLLCWWQRIFMFPLMLISLLAIWKKDKHVTDYLLVLSLAGLVFGLYHYYIEWGGEPLLPCAADALAASCSRRYVFAFHYITIPLMAVTIFGISAGALLIRRQQERN